MGDFDSGMHNACSFALESPLKDYWTQLFQLCVFHEAGAGSTQCGVDSGVIGRPE